MPAFGSALRWVATTLGYGDTADGYQQMSAEAEQVPPGCDGVRFDPTFAGRGTPDWTPGTAEVRGLRLDHGRAHLARAALEGLASQINDALTAVGSAGVDIARLTLVGGGARSRMWNQLLADVTGTAVEVPTDDPQQAPLRGAAASAWVGLGGFNDLANAAENATGPLRRFTPAVPTTTSTPPGPRTPEPARKDRT